MTLYSKVLVYPEGDSIEISHNLTFNQLVDLNGVPVRLPLSSERMIVYRIYKISTRETKGENITYYHLELVTGNELFRLANKSFT